MQRDAAAASAAAPTFRVGGRLLRSLAALSLLSASSFASRTSSRSQQTWSSGCLQGCSGHGRCREGSWCECDEHWAGDTCAYFVQSSALAAIADAGTPEPPPPAGSVNRVDASVAECQDWCSGHGHCEAGLCACATGWTGSDCSVQMRCQDECNSPSGSCVDGVCVCEVGFGGPSCAERICPNGCWGRGRCVDGHCACSQGWEGDDCSLQAAQAATTLASWPVDAEAVQQQAPAQEWPVQPPSPSQTQAKVVAKARPVAQQSRRLRPAPTREEHSNYIIPRLLRSSDTAAQNLRSAAAKVASPQRQAHPAAPVPAALVQAGAAAAAVQSGAAALAQVATSHRQSTVEQLLLQQQQLQQQQQQQQQQWQQLQQQQPAEQTGACMQDCSGHGSCVSGACNCTDGWSGEACDLEPCPNGCNGRGTCLMGSCACSVEFYGLACENLRCPEDCSGQGVCMDGTCVCNAGFVGPSCHPAQPASARASTAGMAQPHPEQAMQVGQQASQRPGLGAVLSKADSVGDRVPCPQDCNGHGRCNSDGKCSCILGYSGDACGDYCPNGCGDHGSCTMGVCLCNVGWEGEDCGRQNCCSGHGSCDIPGSCACQPGWIGDECEVEMACADPTCSSHGTCRLGRCECHAGWSGETCSNWPRECGGPCPTGGTCDRMTGQCLCGATPCEDAARLPTAALQLPAPLAAQTLRGLPAGLSGVQLGVQAGRARQPRLLSPDATQAYVDADQVPDLTQPYASQLKLLGTAAAMATDATEPYVPPPPSCNSPHGHWDDGTGACACEAPYYGDECELMHCPGFHEGLPDCSGNGRCVAGSCVCALGFGKAAGREGPNTCADTVCPVDCGEHGLCKNGQCLCQEGWQGPSCRLPKCANDCSGHGSCYFVTPNSLGECLCEYGYSLPDCSQPALYTRLPECPNSCSGSGLCLGGRCVCSAGAAGVDCSERVCPQGTTGPHCEFASCPRDCDGQGLCLGGKCICGPSRMGPDCSIPTRCYSACGEICMTNIRGQACEVCKGQCLTLTSGDSTLGQHDPLAEMMSTLQMAGHGAGPRNVTSKPAATVSAPHPAQVKPAVTSKDVVAHPAAATKTEEAANASREELVDGSAANQKNATFRHLPTEAPKATVSLSSLRLPECPNDCSGNGLCLEGRCLCTSGFAGADCNLVSLVTCEEGRTGPNCEFEGCPRDCDGSGLCLGGECICNPRRTGPDCSIPVDCLSPCSAVCLADLQGPGCAACKAQCLTRLSFQPPSLYILDHAPALLHPEARPALAAQAGLGETHYVPHAASRPTDRDREEVAAQTTLPGDQRSGPPLAATPTGSQRLPPPTQGLHAPLQQEVPGQHTNLAVPATSNGQGLPQPTPGVHITRHEEVSAQPASVGHLQSDQPVPPPGPGLHTPVQQDVPSKPASGGHLQSDQPVPLSGQGLQTPVHQEVSVQPASVGHLQSDQPVPPPGQGLHTPVQQEVSVQPVSVDHLQSDQPMPLPGQGLHTPVQQEVPAQPASGGHFQSDQSVPPRGQGLHAPVQQEVSAQPASLGHLQSDQPLPLPGQALQTPVQQEVSAPPAPVGHLQSDQPVPLPGQGLHAPVQQEASAQPPQPAQGLHTPLQQEAPLSVQAQAPVLVSPTQSEQSPEAAALVSSSQAPAMGGKSSSIVQQEPTALRPVAQQPQTTVQPAAQLTPAEELPLHQAGFGQPPEQKPLGTPPGLSRDVLAEAASQNATSAEDNRSTVKREDVPNATRLTKEDPAPTTGITKTHWSVGEDGNSSFVLHVNSAELKLRVRGSVDVHMQAHENSSVEVTVHNHSKQQSIRTTPKPLHDKAPSENKEAQGDSPPWLSTSQSSLHRWGTKTAAPKGSNTIHMDAGLTNNSALANNSEPVRSQQLPVLNGSFGEVMQTWSHPTAVTAAPTLENARAAPLHSSSSIAGAAGSLAAGKHLRAHQEVMKTVIREPPAPSRRHHQEVATEVIARAGLANQIPAAATTHPVRAPQHRTHSETMTTVIKSASPQKPPRHIEKATKVLQQGQPRPVHVEREVKVLQLGTPRPQEEGRTRHHKEVLVQVLKNGSKETARLHATQRRHHVEVAEIVVQQSQNKSKTSAVR